MNPIVKVLISAVLVGLISEIAKRNSSFAALVASLPLISVMAMIWLYHETHNLEKIASFSSAVVWYVLPSLILFILLPVCLKTWRMAFYPALALSCFATVLGYFLMKFVLSRFQIEI